MLSSGSSPWSVSADGALRDGYLARAANGDEPCAPRLLHVCSALPSFGDLRTPIDDYAACEEQVAYCPDPKPGVLWFRDTVLRAFPGTASAGISRRMEVGGRSEHKEGRAWDWRVSADDQREEADHLLDWLLSADSSGNAHAGVRRLGVMYIIWDFRIWSSYRADEGWRAYRGPNPHTDHVHFSFSWDGALCRTSWWHQRGARASDLAAHPGLRQDAAGSDARGVS